MLHSVWLPKKKKNQQKHNSEIDVIMTVWDVGSQGSIELTDKPSLSKSLTEALRKDGVLFKNRY